MDELVAVRLIFYQLGVQSRIAAVMARAKIARNHVPSRDEAVWKVVLPSKI